MGVIILSIPKFIHVQKKSYIFFFIGMIFLFSCEGGTTFSKIINNKSTETISVKTITLVGGDQTLIISPNESKTIFFYDDERGFVDDSYNCIQEFDSIEIGISNNKTLVKNILQSDNWERESSGGRNSKEKCTFVISDEDLE